jgi:hypothetical protein
MFKSATLLNDCDYIFKCIIDTCKVFCNVLTYIIHILFMLKDEFWWQWDHFLTAHHLFIKENMNWILGNSLSNLNWYYICHLSRFRLVCLLSNTYDVVGLCGVVLREFWIYPNTCLCLFVEGKMNMGPKAILEWKSKISLIFKPNWVLVCPYFHRFFFCPLRP